MSDARRSRMLRDILLTTTALVAGLAGGGKGAAGAGSSASGLSGMQVQSGKATLSTPTPTKSVITQSTSKAIISWSAFGIPAGSSVQFIQPGASSVALNRVSGGSVSQIMGSLSANGQVWIVNPAGVFFGPGAQVDVAGLMATTSDIKNGDFLSGTYQFGIGSSNPNASIVNQGHIKVAPGGSAVLAGARVDNQGLIEAQLGSVVLGGAKTFAVDFQGDKLLSFQVTGAVDQRPQEATGSPAAALVTNEGTVRATGGTVLITARAAKNIIDNVINSSGIVEAQSAKLVNGEIILDGGDTGAVRVTGSLDASGPGTGETGGTVKVLGNQVALAAGATIDVSGEAGGGTALIGGNFHGSGPEANAATTTISAGARINASALTKGNGGKVAVWSDTLTTFAGTILATGGSLSGNGGFVETSSRNILQAFGTVSAKAVNGSAGTWLLDPANITISTANDSQSTDNGDTSPTDTFTATGSATSSVVNVTSLLEDLNEGTNILVLATGGGVGGSGNITVAANLIATIPTTAGSAGAGLTLQAGPSGSVIVNNNITIENTTSKTLSVSLLAGANGGSISLGSGDTIATNGGSVNLSAGSPTGLISIGNTSTITTGGGSANFIVGSTASTTTGLISLGTGDVINTTGGAGAVKFAILGTTGGSTGSILLGASDTVSTGGGAVTFTAGVTAGSIAIGNGASILTGGGNVSFNDAVILGTASSTGTVTVNTTGAGGSGNITFGNTVNAAPSATVGLIANAGTIGALDFNGVIGGTATLTSLTASGRNVTLSGVGTTAAAGVGSLSVTAATLTTLDGLVYHSSGNESFSGAVLLGSNETITSDSGNISFGSPINGAFSLSLVAASGTVNLGNVGASTPLTSLLVDPAAIALNGTTYETSGDQTYSLGVTLGANATLTSTAGSIHFVSTIDGAFALSAAASSGTVGIGGVIGSQTALASFSANGQTVGLTGIGSSGSDGVTGTVSIAGTSLITLAGSAYRSGGSENFSGPVSLQHDAAVISDSGDIRFVGTTSTINGGFALSLTAASSSGTVSLGGSVGSATALTSLVVDPATIALGGATYHTTLGQTYSVGVSLGADATLISDQGSIGFLATIDGSHSLSLSAASGMVNVGGLIGSQAALANLTATGQTVALSGIDHAGSAGVTGGVSIAGTSVIDLAGSVYHSGGSESFTGPVVLLSNEVITSDSSAVTFHDKVDGAFGLTATATGLTSFDGAVGSGTPLASLTVTNGADINGGSVATTGAQNYDGAVALSASALLTAGSIIFHDKVDGGFGLTATATGLTTFDGAVGSGTALASLTVTNGADLNGGSVATTGAQNYDGAVTLSASALLTAGSIVFHDKVDGAFGLTATATGLTTFDGAVGSGTALASLTVTNAADLNGGSVATTGAQNYDGAVTLSASALLTAGSITFQKAVDGTFGLTAAAGLTTFDGAVGLGSALSNLTVTSTADLNGGSVTTSGAQTYEGPVVLTANELLTASTITFQKAVDGTFGLTAAAGLTTFDGAVGLGSALSSLTVTNTADLNGGSVTTSGTQNYDGSVVLTSDALLTAGSITFSSTVDGAHGLTATATGLTTFDGAVGSGTALASLTVTNAADLNGGSVTTTGAQTYDGAVVLTTNALLTGSAITFARTVDGAFGLTATATGLTTFDGAVGSGTALASLTVTNGADLNGGSVTTSGAQTYDGPVVLTTDAVLTGSAITFQETVDGAFGLTATATGLTSFDGAVGSGTPLASLTVTNGADINGGSVATTGAQNYDGAVALSASALLTAGSIIFHDKVDGGFGLTATATGLTTFDGAVGSGTALASLTVTNGADLNGGSVATTGAQNYDGAVTLSASALLTAGSIVFHDKVDGAFGLTATATGLTTFDGAVGSGTALASLTVTNAADLNGGSVATTGAQNYDGAVTLSASALLTAGSITFQKAVDGTFGLTAAAGLTTFDGAVGLGSALSNLTVTSTADLNGGSVTTSGAQTYEGPVVLTANELLTASTITFQKAVDGTFGLTAAAGLTTFDGAVGLGSALSSLTVTNTADLNGGSVTTSGTQNYDGSVVLTSDALLTAGSITFSSTVDGAHGLTATATGLTTFDGAVGSGTALASLTVTNAADLNGGSVTTTGAQTYDGAVVLTTNALLTGSAITFARTVDGAFGLTATATGLTTFDGAVGSGTALASLTVTNGADLNGGSVTTSGAQTYDGPVVLTTDAVLTGSAITFQETVDGAFGLTATATGLTSFDGAVGSGTPLASLTVTNGADINGGSVATTGAQNYDGAVALSASALLTAGSIIFHDKVDGGFGLTATATGLTTFDGAVGSGTALASLTVTNGADLNGGSVATTGAQNYDGAVTLSASALLTAGSIVFHDKVDGAFGLTATATGLTTFDGAVGSGTALASLTVTNGADLNGGSVATTGAQNYDGAVTLSASALLTAGSIVFHDKVDGAFGLTATATGLTTFDGAVGSGTALASLTVTNAADLNGGSVATTGAQNYDGAVTLSASALLTAGSIIFHDKVDGGFGFTATATGLTTFDGAVGSGTPLASLTVTNGADLNGGSITTAGEQNYDGPVVLTSNALLTGTAITFLSTVDGAHGLTATATGLTTFDGAVGTGTPLASLTVTNAADLNGGSITTAGAQTYDGSVVLTTNGLLTGSAITFAKAVDGAFGLTAAAGLTTFDGTVGSGTMLTSLTVTGTADLNGGSVTTSGAQAYDAVSLGAATTLNPGSGSLIVSGALVGNANLTVLGGGGDTFASINLETTGILDLSGKTAGTFTVAGAADAAGLITGTNGYTLALLGGGNIGDPTLANTGGDTLSGSFVFANGLTIPGTLTLAGNTTLDTETSGIVLGPVQQGSDTFIVIADAVTLNGPWTGTGPRGITPFSSALSIGLGDSTPGSWTLTSAELQILADPPSFVVVGAGTAIGQEIQDIGGSNTAFVPNSGPGPINVGTFTFNAPLYLIGSSIVLDGTLSKTTGGVGFITPGSISGPGSLDLGPGTGILAIAAGSADLNGTVNGTGGSAAAGETQLVGSPGTGPYLINGVCFGGASCGTGSAGPNLSLLNSLVLYANGLNSSQGGLASGGEGTGSTTGGSDTLAGISPTGGPGSDTSAPTDAAVDALSGPLNTKPPSQAQPRVQGYYVSLLGSMLFEWRELSRATNSNTMPEENNQFSGWGNEARW